MEKVLFSSHSLYFALYSSAHLKLVPVLLLLIYSFLDPNRLSLSLCLTNVEAVCPSTSPQCLSYLIKINNHNTLMIYHPFLFHKLKPSDPKHRGPTFLLDKLAIFPYVIYVCWENIQELNT